MEAAQRVRKRTLCNAALFGAAGGALVLWAASGPSMVPQPLLGDGHGLAGLAAVAFLGGLFGRPRSGVDGPRLQDELRSLAQACELLWDDPEACETFLEDRRRRAHDLSDEGALSRSELYLLETRIDELLRDVRLDALEGLVPRTPDPLGTLLTNLLGQGPLDRATRQEITRSIDATGQLGAHERDALEALVDAWYERDTGAASPDAGASDAREP